MSNNAICISLEIEVPLPATPPLPPQQAQADQQAELMRQKLEEKRQQRSVSVVAAPTAVAPPSMLGDAKAGGEHPKEEKEVEVGRRKWSDPVGMPILARRRSVTVLVTEGEMDNNINNT